MHEPREFLNRKGKRAEVLYQTIEDELAVLDELPHSMVRTRTGGCTGVSKEARASERT